MEPLRNFIGGRFVEARSGRRLWSREPATGAPLYELPDSDEPDVDDAVRAATDAFPQWSSRCAAERAGVLRRAADLLESRAEAFAEAESRDQGKPLWLARSVDLRRAVLNLRHFAGTALCDREQCVSEGGALHYTLRSAVGVAAVIVPWNLPLYLLTFKLAPALAYGNTVVAKPSEVTSLTAHMLAALMQEAGLPDGVLNVVLGRGPSAGAALVRHPGVALVSFTGSDRAGMQIAALAPAKKLSLEMGGKNACIVFEDADLDECVNTLIRSSFLNAGQICLSTSRIFVQRPVFEAFVRSFVERAREIRVGDPQDPATWMGPLASEEHLRRVRGYLRLAKEEGAVFLLGEEQELPDLPPRNRQGYFVRPSAVTGLGDGSRCMQEEVFGPLACLLPFDAEAEAVARANAVRYGLCACLWTRDAGRAHRLAPRLQVGTVWVNCWLVRNLHMPFGGQKLSGLGREGTDDSREFYTTKTTVCLKYAQDEH